MWKDFSDFFMPFDNVASHAVHFHGKHRSRSKFNESVYFHVFLLLTDA
jgi:hypothetical protein